MQGRGLETPVSPLAGSPRADGLGWVDRAPIPPSQPMELQVDSLFFFYAATAAPSISLSILRRFRADCRGELAWGLALRN